MCIIKLNMKHAIFKRASCAAMLLLLLALICVMIFPAVTIAEDPALGVYMVKSGSALQLRSNDAAAQPVIDVPSTYYVTLKSSAATAGYYTVSYAGSDYLVTASDFTSAAELHNAEKYGSVPVENMSLSFAVSSLFPQGEFSTYTYSGDNMTASNPAKAEEITAVYGILTLQNVSYYYVNIHTQVFGMPIDTNVYIAAAEVAAPYSSYTSSTIPANPYEAVKAEIDEEATINQNPAGNEEGSAETPDPDDTDNNLERIILSIVIAVLCVAVVLLIFRPGRKSKKSQS